MANKSDLLDRWLRPAGAALLVSIGLLFLILSFVAREGKNFEGEQKKSLIGRMLFSAAFVENWFYDIRTSRFYQHERKSPNLVVLEITDASLGKVGRWPWTRTKHALILDNLKKYGAKVVMFDGLFPEPESDAADGALAAAITRFSADNYGSVFLGYGTTSDPNDALPIPDALQLSGVTGRPGKQPLNGSAFVDKNNFAAPALTLFEAKYGFINASPDLDGVFRHQQILNEQDGTFFPSLGFGGFVDFHSNGQDRKVLVEASDSTLEYTLRVLNGKEERSVLLSSRGELKVRFFGAGANFERVQIEDVVFDKNPAANEGLKKIFAGKAVLIGSSAFGAHDLRHTPVDPQTPGLYMHANLFHAVDQNFFFRPEDESLFLSLALFLIGVAGVLVIFQLKSPIAETGGVVLLAGGIFAADYFYFAPEGYFIRLFFCLFAAVSLHAWFTVLNVFKDAKEKKKIRDTFTRYVAPEIVKEMLQNPEKLKVGGEKREITMLFSDVRDFTKMSERLSPQELATLLNIYMGRMTDILFETGGTLDKYIGDALVGFWGAPLELPNHSYQAVRGAKLMVEALPAINQEFEKRKFPRISVGIGLNTGEVSVGNMGSDRIFQYTALGDAMNLASRIESLTKQYGVNLMISEFTHHHLGAKRSEFQFRPLDCVQVKGKSKAVKIYEVLADWNPWAKEPALLAKYTQAYEEKYLRRHFAEAITLFDEILAILPGDKNTLKLKMSAEAYLAAPPPSGWDGVTIYDSK
jgi:adenylate cyclase